MCRHHEVAGPLPAALQHVDLGRPAAVIGEHPERRPDAVSHRQFCADFKVSVLLRELALAGQDARDVLVVEQHRLQFGRGAAGDDREYAIAHLERIEPERRRGPAAVARIDIDLLLAIGAGLALEIGALAAPVARVRPRGAAGVMRHPPFSRQRMLVEIVVEGSVQGQEGKRCRVLGFDAAAFDRRWLGGRLQREFFGRDLEIVLRERRRDRRRKADRDQDSECQCAGHSFLSQRQKVTLR